MRRPARWAAALAVAMLLLPAAVAGVATAQRTDVSGTRTYSMTVQAQSHDVFVIRPATGHSVSISLRVTSGGPVDVYAMPPVGYDSYTSTSASEFSTFQAINGENTTTYDGRVVATGEPVFLVVDNANLSSKGANTTGPVSYVAAFTDNDSTLSTALVLVGAATALGFGSLAVVGHWLRGRSGLPPPPAPGSTAVSPTSSPRGLGATCPQCASPVPSGAAACPACGRALR